MEQRRTYLSTAAVQLAEPHQGPLTWEEVGQRSSKGYPAGLEEPRALRNGFTEGSGSWSGMAGMHEPTAAGLGRARGTGRHLTASFAQSACLHHSLWSSHSRERNLLLGHLVMSFMLGKGRVRRPGKLRIQQQPPQSALLCLALYSGFSDTHPGIGVHRELPQQLVRGGAGLSPALQHLGLHACQCTVHAPQPRQGGLIGEALNSLKNKPKTCVQGTFTWEPQVAATPLFRGWAARCLCLLSPHGQATLQVKGIHTSEGVLHL